MAQPRKSFNTPKGTELPLLNLKGKEYLQIMHRLVWFREENRDALIKTALVDQGGDGKDKYYVFRAEVYVPDLKGELRLVATGHKRETVGDFPDAMEKAEMGSIGRALGILGYGTQFAADDLDEGTRLADSPAPVVETTATTQTATTEAAATKKSSFRRKTDGAATATAGNDL